MFHSENFKLITALTSKSSEGRGLGQENIEFLQASVCRSFRISCFSEIHVDQNLYTLSCSGHFRFPIILLVSGRKESLCTLSLSHKNK